MLDITGQTTGDLAATGPRLAASPYPTTAIFEIVDRWRRSRPPEVSRGPTGGINFWTYARLISYWFAPSEGSDAQETFWDADRTNVASSTASPHRLTPICFPVTGPRHVGSSSGSGSSAAWKGVLYPSCEPGQWVQCHYDHAGGIWRVTESFERTVRFQLLQPLASLGNAKARVFGSSPSDSSSSGSRRWRGTITVHDVIGSSADAGTLGYAQRFADARRWEVVALGTTGDV